MAELEIPDPERRCLVDNCTTTVGMLKLFCQPHWDVIPKELQRNLYRRYRKGQEFNSDLVTEKYSEGVFACRAAIKALTD